MYIRSLKYSETKENLQSKKLLERWQSSNTGDWWFASCGVSRNCQSNLQSTTPCAVSWTFDDGKVSYLSVFIAAINIRHNHYSQALRTRYFRTSLTRCYHIRMEDPHTEMTLKAHLFEIFKLQKTSFKFNFGFGVVLRHKEDVSLHSACSMHTMYMYLADRSISILPRQRSRGSVLQRPHASHLSSWYGAQSREDQSFRRRDTRHAAIARHQVAAAHLAHGSCGRVPDQNVPDRGGQPQTAGGGQQLQGLEHGAHRRIE